MKRLSSNQEMESIFPIYHKSAKNIESQDRFNSKFIDRIKQIKNKKVSAINEHIRIRTVKQNNMRKRYSNNREQKMNSNSLQLPLGMLKQEKQEIKSNSNLQLDMNNTATNFINFFLGSRPGVSTRVREKTITSFKSMNSKPSKRQRQKNSLENESVIHTQKMRNLSKYLNEQKLGERLRMFSKEHGKNSIRVYKQDIHKMIVHRFSKDRMTILLDTEYIEDFNSVLQTMKDMVNLKKSQVLVLTFLIMDQNKDGFISPEDLLSLMGVKKQTPSPYNQLIMHDILKIIEYIQKQKQRGNLPIMDITTNNILKDQTLTFMKYRINHLKSRKTGEQQTKSGLMSGKMKNYLFCLKDENEKIEKLQEKFDLKNLFLNILNSNTKRNKKLDKNQLLFSEKQNFSINFDRFSYIFGNEIPKIFLDFLFLLGGLQVPGQKYLPIDNSILSIQASEEKKEEQQEDKMVVVRRRLQKMNVFKKQFRVERMSTQP